MDSLTRTLSLIAGSVLLASSVPALAQKAHRRAHSVHKAVVVKKVTTVKHSPVAGTWFLKQGQKENRSALIALKDDGTFVFKGPAWISKGKYQYEKGALVLNWTEVDSEKVAPGTMHKSIPLSSDGSTFSIDQFTYAKHSD
jgi:hypothetical protein